MQVEDEKLDGYTTQLQTIETSCLYLLGKEDEAKQKLTKRPTLAGDNGFNTVPTIDDVIPVDPSGNEVPLNDQQKANNSVLTHVDICRLRSFAKSLISSDNPQRPFLLLNRSF